MSGQLVYRPHVRSDGAVYTPDLTIARAWMEPGGNGAVPLPVDRLTTATELQQPGREGQGVAALVAVAAGDGPLLTVGSLHSAGAAAPGLLACARPLSRQAWRLSEVLPHFDRLILRSWHLAGPRRTPATEEAAGAAADPAAWCSLPAEHLVLVAARHAPPPAGPVDGFAVALEDPVRNETLALAYAIVPIG